MRWDKRKQLTLSVLVLASGLILLGTGSQKMVPAGSVSNWELPSASPVIVEEPTESSSTSYQTLSSGLGVQTATVSPRSASLENEELSAKAPREHSGSAVVAQQTLTRLYSLGLRREPLTLKLTAELSPLFLELRKQGSAALPAISEFLRRNEDVVFDIGNNAKLTEFNSLRLGLINTLASLGKDAVPTAAEVLQGTGEPMEIALLTRILEHEQPGVYRELELAAASEVLDQANLQGAQGADLASLFETLQAVGDESVLPTLKQAATHSNYYATLALAGLADGIGIPALIELARDPATIALGIGDYALRPLAQVAASSPDAAQALLDLARLNQIRDTAWPTVAAALAGSYIQYGKQIFGSTAPPVNWTAEEVSRRIALLRTMRSVTANGTARQSLQDAIIALSNRKVPKQ